MIDYALWEVIENGNIAPKTTVVEGVEKVIPPTKAEEKAQKRLEVKARSTLMMSIPNEHQLKFNSIKDAKLLMEAVEKRFGGNTATKKTQRNLLKNKDELEKMNMDDIYNNLKVYEPEVKGMSSSSLSTHNMAFVSSSNNNSGSSNEVDNTAQTVNTAYGVATANTQVNTANSLNVDNLNDVVIYAFLASQPNRRRHTVNSNENIGFEKSKVECYNCHKKRHFSRECRAPRNQDYKNKERTKRTVPVEISTSTTLVSCDGLGGYDWSDQAEEGPNYALMAYSSSSFDLEVSNNSNCSKSCLKTIETLKSQYDQLHKDFKKSELMVLAYKTRLKSVEKKLEVYKANESIYSHDIKVLKFEIECKDIAIRELRKKLEISQKEKDSIHFNVDKFENASKSLDKLIESQIVDNYKKGLGYNAVPPPYTRNFMPPTPDLSFTGLDEPKAVVNAARPKAVVNDVKGNNVNAVKASACWVWKPKTKVLDHGNPQMDLQDKGVIDSGCSRHMTGNMSYLTDYEEIDGGYVAFGGNPKGGKITGKCTIKTGRTKKVISCIKGSKLDRGYARRASTNSSYKKFGLCFDNNESLPTDPLMPDLEDSTGIFRGAYDDEDVGAEADLNNLETTMNSIEPKKAIQALTDLSFIEADARVASSAISTSKKSETRQDWLHKVIPKRKELIIMRFLLLLQVKVANTPGLEDPNKVFPKSFIRWKKLYMVYIKLLEPGMRPCLPTYRRMDLEEAL
ncbi:ribonuclease H-like domain-containing protein [Tanacetum coccineum]